MHFIRRVASTDEALEPGYIQILNVPWKVGGAHQGKGVWATLKFEASEQAWLRVYDAAPDVSERKCLAIHRFPIKDTSSHRQSTAARINFSKNNTLDEMG